jgi:hypothetical protein
MTECPWTDERVEELLKLERVLALAESLNRTTDVIANITQIEQMARELSFCDLSECRSSFLNFLREQAIASRDQTGRLRGTLTGGDERASGRASLTSGSL